MASVAVTDADFQQHVLESDKPVLVDFWAPWCGPCQMAGPVLEELSEEYADKAVVAKVNIDENQEYARQFSVMSIPTVILFQGGEEKDRKIGFSGKQGYTDMLDKAV